MELGAYYSFLRVTRHLVWRIGQIGRNFPHAQGAPLGGFVQEMIMGSNVTLADLSDDIGSVIVSLG
jgi:hypothetical protein